MKRIDDHMHVSLEPSGHRINGQFLASAEEMIPVMERYHTERAILMSSGETGCLMSNGELREICRRYPEHFSYMAVFDLDNPQGLEERMAAEKEAGAVGIGEFTEGRPFDDERIFRFLEIAQTLRLPLLFHMSPELGVYYGVYDAEGLPLLEKVLKSFPNLPVIAHSQPFWYEMTPVSSAAPAERNQYPQGKIRQEGRVQALLRAYPNLYGDLSANSGGNAIMRDGSYGPRFLEEFSDRLLYGTDLYCTSQQFPLGDYLDRLLAEGRLAPVAYERIVRGNALRLLF